MMTTVKIIRTFSLCADRSRWKLWSECL